MTVLVKNSIIELKYRELAIVAALVAMGEKGKKHLTNHVNAALDAGARRQEIVEMIGTLSQCSGTPTAVNGIAAAAKVFDTRDAQGTARAGEEVFEPGDAPVNEGNEARYKNAQVIIQKVYPAGPTDDTYTTVAHIAPHFWRNMATFFYNDIFLHPGADISLRELGIFSAYVAMSIVPLQLKWHANGALNNGWSAEQLAEIIQILEPYVGYANAFQSTIILKEVFAARSAGIASTIDEKASSADIDAAIKIVHEIAPGLIANLDQTTFADLKPTHYFDEKTGALLAISALIAQGTSQDLLRIELINALQKGISQEEITQLISFLKNSIGEVLTSTAEHVAKNIFSEKN